jgi:branched-chain amino acid transport system ATP-binding protein
MSFYTARAQRANNVSCLADVWPIVQTFIEVSKCGLDLSEDRRERAARNVGKALGRLNLPMIATEQINSKPALLEVQNLVVNYGVIAALHGISLTIRKGDIVTLIGANGAGKTTTLRAISGLLRPKSGSICYAGEDITGCAPHRIVKRGLAQVPEGRMVFANLTVAENLEMGAYLRGDKGAIRTDLEFVFTVFPRLLERRSQVAGTLSGGEQQMLAIGRALMSRPSFLMLDEPSLGIAPLLVKAIFEKIVEINRQQGITILLVEQNANLALEISHYGYVLETGRIILHDQSACLKANPQVVKAYLGG